MADSQFSKRPGSPPRRQRACLNCSRIKARCHFQDENVGKYCDRCHRMGVECTSQTTKSIRRPRQLMPFTRWRLTLTKAEAPAVTDYRSRVASLEQKIDGITSLLAAGHTSQADSQPAIPSVSDEPVAPPLLYSSGPTPASLPPQQVTLPILPSPVPSHDSHPHPMSQPTLPVRPAPTPSTPGYGLNWDQADLALAEYQVRFMPQFPFVVIDPDVEAKQLFTTSPFVFRVIMLVASRLSYQKKAAMKRNVLAYLGQHLLVNEERELDLLQGLLIFIAWADLQFYLDRQITHLISLATGYAYNLGLTRIPPLYLGRERFIDVANDANEAMFVKDHKVLEAMEKFHSIEEQRCLLGCYYLASVNAAQFARRNPFRTLYAGMCVNYFGHLEESYMDSTLEKLVRLQMVSDKISETFPAYKDPDRNKAFTYLINDEMRPIRSELDKIAESIDQDHPQFPFFWMHYNAVLVRLYEPATYLSSPPHLSSASSSYRSQCLANALQAAKAYFETLLGQPAEELLFRPFVSYAGLIAVITSSSKLLLLRADGWDLAEARRTLDFSAVMARLLDRIRQAGHLAQQRSGVGAGSEEHTVFDKHVAKLSFIKGWFDIRIAGETTSAAPTAAEAAELPADYDIFQQQDNQFWLGLLGNDTWNFEL